MIERKPDGGLSERIDFIEMVGSPDDAELLCLLLELRRHREDKQGLIEQLEAAQRDAKLLEAANISLDAESCKLRNRAEAAEAELKRRGALEPDYILHQCGCCGHETTGRITRCPKCNYEPVAQRPLYDAAPAAVLPTDIVIKAEVARVGGLILKGCESEYQDDAARRVFNAMLAAATAPGGGDDA